MKTGRILDEEIRDFQVNRAVHKIMQIYGPSIRRVIHKNINHMMIPATPDVAIARWVVDIL